MSMTENHTIAELLYENGKLSAELEAERFMIQQITSLSSTELIDDGINTVLREVGEYTCADRAYVFEINEDYTTCLLYTSIWEGEFYSHIDIKLIFISPEKIWKIIQLLRFNLKNC